MKYAQFNDQTDKKTSQNIRFLVFIYVAPAANNNADDVFSLCCIVCLQ